MARRPKPVSPGAERGERAALWARLRRHAAMWRRFAAVHWRVLRDRLPPLPPGRFSGEGRVEYDDDRALFRRAARHGAVFRCTMLDHPFVVVADLAKSRALLGAHGDKLVTPDGPYNRLVPGGDLRHSEGEAHRTLKRAIVQALRASLVVQNAPALRRIVREALGALTVPAPTRADFDRALAAIADQSLLLVVFGAGPGDPPCDAFAEGYARLGADAFVWNAGPEQARAAADLYALVAARARRFRAEPGAAPPNAHAALAAAEASEGAIAADDPRLVANLVYMVEMGRYDIRGLLRWVIHYLAAAPEHFAALREAARPPVEAPVSAGTGETGGSALAAAVVQETLRLDQSESMTRWVRESFAFEGMGVPRSSFLHLCTREAHRNPAVFPEPDRFDPARFVGRTYDADSYAPFGLGHHRCVAADIVVRLGALVAEELAVGFDLTVLADGPRHHGPFHWEPSPDFAIALAPRHASPA